MPRIVRPAILPPLPHGPSAKGHTDFPIKPLRSKGNKAKAKTTIRAFGVNFASGVKRGGVRAAYTHHVSGSGMGSFFCAFTRLSTQRTITSTATPTISRKPISASIRMVLMIPPIRPSQKVRMR